MTFTSSSAARRRRSSLRARATAVRAAAAACARRSRDRCVRLRGEIAVERDVEQAALAATAHTSARRRPAATACRRG